MGADNVLEDLPNGEKEARGAEIHCIYTKRVSFLNDVASGYMKKCVLKADTWYPGWVPF